MTGYLNGAQRHRAGLSRHLLRARDFIDSHYDETISVAEIARAANVSASYFARQFHGAFGETPHQYLSSRRLARAASLLRNTDYSVAFICISVGFSSVGSFTSAFGRVYGLTPTRYRAQHLPATMARVIPPCILDAVERPQLSRMEEDLAARRGVGWDAIPAAEGVQNVCTGKPRHPFGCEIRMRRWSSSESSDSRFART